MKNNLEHLVAGPQSGEPTELISWTIIAGVTFFLALIVFFFWIDLMYMSLSILALGATCGLSYLVYWKYGGEKPQEEEVDNSNRKDIETNDEFTKLEQKED